MNTFTKLVSLSLLACASLAAAQDKGKTVPIRFAPAKSSIKMSGSVKGDGSARYELAAKAGQTLSVSLKSKSTFVYFNVLDKKTGFALEADPAPREVTTWTGKLKNSGTYIVQIYLVRAAARRGQTAKFDLTVGLKPFR